MCAGQIPEEIGNLLGLELLSITAIKGLTGSLPNDMCQHLPKLEVLYLYSNELSGNIPSSMGKCSNLKNLSLSLNQLTGIIPRSIGNLTQLRELYLGFNNLEGQIPKEIGNLFGLEMLSITAIKGLTSQIPTSIFNVSSLKAIDLSSNSLSGSLPNDMCQHLPKLEGLNLGWNELSGNIFFTKEFDL
ncbi:brassinosteroid LRR receptor kinase-like [Gossypium hirsutum]|uniref:Brassinosteroid LRR receptor kinase-like n=1 Tax=Gossypium hirsutum TaxID=3635 RepID=A0A1U8J0W9_GOSHI|nr:brassinosteroid LRR receptor kinase-like [Gossypium hirsutum]